MKKLVFFMGLLLSLGMFCACSNDDEDVMLFNKQETRTSLFIKDVSGEMAYSDTKEWHIVCGVPGTYDSTNDYYPSELNDEFKVEGLKVIISGEVLGERVDSIQYPGGYEVFNIELTKIEKAE